MQKGAICHLELPSGDFERSKKFYTELFGWKFESFDPQYLMFTSPDGIGGGFYKSSSPNPGGGAQFYVWVDEHDSYIQRVPGLGGKVLVEKQDVHGMGSFSSFADPDGNPVGIWVSKTP